MFGWAEEIEPQKQMVQRILHETMPALHWTIKESPLSKFVLSSVNASA